MKKFVLGVVLFLCLSACSDFQKIVKSNDWKQKYDAGLAYYNQGDYYRASVLFEDLQPILLGKAESEQVQFFYAYCQYHLGMYAESSYSFKNFHDTYRRSQYAEEALYMYAYSLYQGSPSANLDQSNTNAAIEAMQDFINRYPRSSFVEPATGLLIELRKKLEVKGFTLAKQYLKLERHKAAVVAFENFQKDFPDSDFREESSFLQIQSQFQYAKQSFENLQKERYEKVISYYEYFIDRYPNSKFTRQSENIFEASRRALNNLNKATKSL